MAVGISEDQKSRSIDMDNGGGQSTRVYTMRDYTEADDAYRGLREYAPSNIWIYGFNLIRTGIKIDPDFSDPLATLYRGTVTYKSPTMEGTVGSSGGGGGGGGGGGDDVDLPANAPKAAKQDKKKPPVVPEDPSKVWFTFGTRQKTILQAENQFRWKRKEDGSWPNHTNPQKSDKDINRDADDVAPEGVTVDQGAMFMHVTAVLPPSRVTPVFYKSCAESLMQLNSKPFAWFDRAQVQFQGIDIEEQQGGDFHVTWHFEIRIGIKRREFHVSVDGEKYDINLAQLDGEFDGFNYTWLTYQDVEAKDEADDNGNAKVTYSRKCDSINLAQVFPYARWNTSGCLKYCKPPKHQKKNWKSG